MDYLEEYFTVLIAGQEVTALWIVVGAAALWGCLLGVTGVLALQGQIAGRRKDRA